MNYNGRAGSHSYGIRVCGFPSGEVVISPVRRTETDELAATSAARRPAARVLAVAIGLSIPECGAVESIHCGTSVGR